MKHGERWKTLNEVPIPEIVPWTAEASKSGQALHIGTDSMQTNRYTQFVTVVIVHTPTKGARAAYTRSIVPRITSLRERLTKEVWLSIEVAMQLAHLDPALTVHIDVNAQERHMSSKYLQELCGLVMGQNFKVLWKPDSWAASHAADHVVRFHGKLPKERVA